MLCSRGWLLCAVAAGFFVRPALAEPTNAHCLHFSGRYEPIREVIGEVTTVAIDRLGVRHIIVQDQNSGCRVFVVTDEQTCTPGKSFNGSGRPRSLGGEDHDVMLDYHYSSEKPACK